MPVFEFRAVDKRREDYAEKGTVVARNEAEAKQKLKQLDLQVTTLKRMGGLAGLIKAFTADIR